MKMSALYFPILSINLRYPHFVQMWLAPSSFVRKQRHQFLHSSAYCLINSSICSFSSSLVIYSPSYVRTACCSVCNNKPYYLSANGSEDIQLNPLLHQMFLFYEHIGNSKSYPPSSHRVFSSSFPQFAHLTIITAFHL